MTKSRKWKKTRSKGKYLYPKQALRKVFKGKFMAELKGLAKSGTIDLPSELREKLYGKKWVVYAKRPFARPVDVLEYLGRYTHKTAISNYRIKGMSEQAVTFRYKDYKTGGTNKEMTLQTTEFIRRFALHILPHGFARIRHYGLLSSRGQATYLPDLQVSMQIIRPKRSKEDLRQAALARLKTNQQCPCCGKQDLKAILTFPRGEPPDEKYILNYLFNRRFL